jgi:hypothetical protein
MLSKHAIIPPPSSNNNYTPISPVIPPTTPTQFNITKAPRRKVYLIQRLRDILARRAEYTVLNKKDISMHYSNIALDDPSKNLCTIASPWDYANRPTSLTSHGRHSPRQNTSTTLHVLNPTVLHISRSSIPFFNASRKTVSQSTPANVNGRSKKRIFLDIG